MLSDEVEIGLQSFLTLGYKLSIHIPNELLRGERETEARNLSNIHRELGLQSIGFLWKATFCGRMVFRKLVRKMSAERHANNILFLSFFFFFTKYHRLAVLSNM